MGDRQRKDEKRKSGFLYKIRNRQFQRLFFRNWIQVFVCIVLPLVLCIVVIQHFSAESLVNEVDSAARRSTSNTMVTLEALLREVCDSLEKKVVDESFISFFQMERVEPQNYDYVATVNAVLKQIIADYRENLFHSVDVYSQVGDYIISSPHKAQSGERFMDKSLLETFFEGVESGNQGLFAAPRFAWQEDREGRRVITIYWGKGVGEQKGFVSASLDAEKLISYITDEHDRFQGAYLIVDPNDRVILDTSGQMNDGHIALSAEAEVSAVTVDIDGRTMRIFWMPMNRFGWKCVQMVPMEEFEKSNVRLERLIFLILVLGLTAAVVLSYRTTVRLFRPIEAILRLLENPSEQVRIGDENGEIQYMLVSILELFQKNMTLEQEMLERVVALRSARAKALQEQMTPHFLNNVLQAINWNAIAETGDENSITSKSILLLADILSTGKEQKNNITSVEEEIEYTRKFVELECLRYGPGIHCFYHVAPEAEQMPIPCISLQTLVENSISHGLQPRGASGNIHVSIDVNELQGLHIVVEDDGVGFEEAVIGHIYSMLEKEYIYVGEHLGIINLFQRFRLIYGEKCEFIICRSSYGGACVEIKTPRLPELWIQCPEKQGIAG
ncbi:MAG: histidine kinase [Lachnospiraceae bacterium]|nr:histidine kinase [Lachnospiraceae bacterium]